MIGGQVVDVNLSGSGATKEQLDFIYENIDMLNERLEKRGYGPITNVQMKDEATKTPVSEILEKNNDTPILLKTQAFDARI